jgi:hypothetical protein
LQDRATGRGVPNDSALTWVRLSIGITLIALIV